MDLTQWEKLNPRRGKDETNQAWERELEDDERMRDAPPPPPRSRTNSVSDGDAAPRDEKKIIIYLVFFCFLGRAPPVDDAPPAGLALYPPPTFPVIVPLISSGSETQV